MTEFGIFDKTFAATSDTARNIVHCLRDLMSEKMVYIPCYCHVLNLIANNVLNEENEISNLISLCRKLVGCFKHSSTLSDQLTSYHKLHNMSEIKLKQDVPTRWNSTYIMLNSIMLNYSGIKSVLGNPKNNDHCNILLDGSHLDTIEQIILILEPLFNLTEVMSGSSYPSASLVQPSVCRHQKLCQILENIIINNKKKSVQGLNFIIVCNCR